MSTLPPQDKPTAPLFPTLSPAADNELQISSQQVLLLQAEFLSRKRFAEASTALARKLVAALNCEQASIGWLSQDHAEVIATSYSNELHARQESTRLLAAAMEEATEQGCSLIYPEPNATKSLILLAHAELARHHGDAVCTIPLVCNSQIVGALILERQKQLFSPNEVAQIEHMATLLAPCLGLKFENDLPLGRRLSADVKTLLQQIGKPQHKAATMTVATLLTLLLALLLIPVSFKINAPARLEGAVQRVLAAPTDGYLYQVHVRPGDHVKAGQLLAELAEQDLLVEQRGLEAELAQQQNALLSAQARNDQAEFVASQGQADTIRAKLDLLRQNLERNHLRAPFDGIVIKGDLSQAVGAPVKLGDELMTLTPDRGYRLLLEVAEADIAHLKPDQTGHLILSALPSHTLAFHIERITPLASTIEGRHYFPAYAVLDAELPALRPGMQGYAKIDIDQRPLLFNCIDRAWHKIRFTLWSWGL